MKRLFMKIFKYERLPFLLNICYKILKCYYNIQLVESFNAQISQRGIYEHAIVKDFG